MFRDSLRAALDIVVFSSAWLAAAAGSLCAASSLAMGFRPAWFVVGLAISGTLVIYCVDRLCDLDLDRATSPERSAFIARHTSTMRVLGLVAGIAAVVLGARAGVSAVLLLAPVLILGLAHRRLKQIPFASAAYVAAAWMIVVVGLPAVVAGVTSNVGWIAAVIGVGLLASTIASNVRDGGASFERLRPGVALRVAQALAGTGLVLAALAPSSVRPLAAVPACVLASVLWFQPGERYGLVVVDGALLLGAVIAIGVGLGLG